MGEGCFNIRSSQFQQTQDTKRQAKYKANPQWQHCQDGGHATEAVVPELPHL
jgi:hypothetical protein